MIAALIPLALKLGVPQRFAKGAIIATLVAIAVLALGLTKCAYDRSVISAHEARQEAATAKADRKADAKAADQRRIDDARLNQEATQLEKVQQNATNDTDRRLARHRCLRMQQAARASGREPPACG